MGILFLWYFCYVIFMKFNVTFESKFLELFPGLKKEGQEGQAKEGGFYAQRTHRKPLLQLMRGKVQGKAEETEMKFRTPGVGLEGLKILSRPQQGNSFFVDYKTGLFLPQNPPLPRPLDIDQEDF